MEHNGRYVRRLHNMIRAKIQGAGFQHHPFRDGRAQVLADAEQRAMRVRGGSSGGGLAKVRLMLRGKGERIP
jgi:hypothetical protein